MILDRRFFQQQTNIVSTQLIGKLLCFDCFKGIILETESYIGVDDPACHAAKGRTQRTQIMFGIAGFSYVYFIYGKYYCFNIVTEELNFPAATLIRAIKLIHPPYTLLDGPGKICRFLGINTSHNAIDVTQSNKLYVWNTDFYPEYTSTARIGISKGKDKMWRYVATDKLLWSHNVI